jgi:hypothetical protein
MDEALRQTAVWTPPPGFTGRIAAGVVRDMPRSNFVESIPWRDMLEWIAVSGIVGGLGYLAWNVATEFRPLVDVATVALGAIDALIGVTAPPSSVYGSPGAWAWVAVSLALMLWWTRDLGAEERLR